VRLLVYGGTLYAERRRIGEWPSSVSSQFLQSTAGLSELSPAYGVGILDDSPFVIFRMMLMHERRNYPFTVLLDPGERWAEFGWNGARLLWLLFDKAVEKGSALIKEPEGFQTEQDLGRLLTQVLEEDAPPPEPEGEAAGRSGERFLHLWTGALTHEGALVLGFGDAELGLAERPRYAEMARRLELLPLSLRGGLGWVVGGNEEYAAALGVELILDNSRTGEAGEDVGRLVDSGRGWLSDWREVEEKAEQGSIEDAPLVALFSKPLPDWLREQQVKFPGYTKEDLLEDVSCVRRLLPGAGASERAQQPPTERLKDILERRHRGPLNKTIEGLYEWLTTSLRQLDRDSTRHYLRKLYEPGGALAVEESRLHREAAVEFAVERGLYPSDGPVPDFIRFDVIKRLLQSEERSEDIPPKLVAEWENLTAEERRELWEVALERSAELPEGMSCWTGYVKDEGQMSIATQVLWGHAGENRAAWDRDYLLFGDDAGGARLLELHPGLVQGVVREAVKALENDDPGAAKLSERAREWLVAAGRTELRRAMPLETKTYLAAKGFENWEGLYHLQLAFQGPATAVPRAADPKEQKYLVGELRELSARVTNATRAPFLLNIVQLIDIPGMIKSQEGMREALDQLESLSPDLAGEAGENWVLGWRAIPGQEVLSKHAPRYRRKFREDAAAYFADPERLDKVPFKLKELSDEEGDDPLKKLLGRLLFEEDAGREGIYGKRLSESRSEIEKDETVRQALRVVLNDAVEGGRNLEGMFRRLGPYEKVFETIRQVLSEEHRARLARAEQQFRDKRLEEYETRVFRLLSGTDGSLADDNAFLNLKNSLTAGAKAEAALFGQAVSQAVTRLLTSPHKSSFLGRFGGSTKTINEIKKCLPMDATGRELDESLAEYSFQQLCNNLEWYLCDGGDSDKLMDKLNKEKDPQVQTSAADSVMERCLADGSKWKRLYDGLMVTTKDGERKLRLDPKESFIKFFGHLSPGMQQRVLRAAYKHHNDLFHNLTLRAYERGQRYEQAAREKRQGEKNPLRDAVLAFLTGPQGSEGYEAKIKLIPSTRLNRDQLDRYLGKFKKFLPAGAEDNGSPAPESTRSEPEQEAASKQGLLGRFVRLIKSDGHS
jgi:hypothetical protein